MNKLGKKLIAAGLCAGLVFGTMTGCGNAGKAVATLDGEKVDYALVNFITRYSQAQMQTMYGSMFGEGFMASYGDSAKKSTVDAVQEMLILEKHMADYQVTVSEEEKAKITEAAKAFMSSNEDSVLKAMTASQQTVERMLTLNLIQTKMRAEMIKDVDTNVTDEEAAQKTIKQVFFSTAGQTDEDGNTTDMTDEEKAAVKKKAQTVLDEVKAGKDMDQAAKAVDENLAASTISYGKENGTVDEAVKTAADGLKDNEIVQTVIEGTDGYYVVQMVSAFDKDATEQQKETILSQRKNDKYTEIYDGWKESVTFTTDEKLLEQIGFADTFELKQTETETTAETTAETAYLK